MGRRRSKIGWALGLGAGAALRAAQMGGDDEQPDVPKPTPDDPLEGFEPEGHEPEGSVEPGQPDNVVMLETMAELASWRIEDVFGERHVPELGSTVFVGFDPLALELVMPPVLTLAEMNPHVPFVLVPFELTREALGEPPVSMMWVATSVSTNGYPLAAVASEAAMPPPAALWASLLEHAQKSQPIVQPGGGGGGGPSVQPGGGGGGGGPSVQPGDGGGDPPVGEGDPSDLPQLKLS